MAVQVDHLIVACHVLADVQAGRITDHADILAKIRAEARTSRAAELFDRAVALNTTLGNDGVARLLGIADGDTIPEEVFDVASIMPLQVRGGTAGGPGGPAAFDQAAFDRTAFVAALRRRWH